MAPMGAKDAKKPEAKAKAEVKKPEVKAKAEPKVKKVKKEEEVDPYAGIEKVEKPDKAATEEAQQKISAEIEKLQKKQREIAEKIGERSGGKDDFFQRKKVIRDQLDEYSAKMNALQEQKEGINKASGDKVQEGKDMKNDLKKLKQSIGYTTEAEIDQRIADLDYKMSTESVSLKAEKDMLKEISELKKNRSKVAGLGEMEGAAGLMIDAGKSMKDQIGQINAEKARLFELKKGFSAQLTELMEERKAQLGDLPDIIQQKEEMGKQVREKIVERNALRDAFREQERAYYSYDQECRKIRYELQNKERNERQAEFDIQRKEKAAEKLDDQPFVAEITLIEQSILFCKTLSKSKDAEKKEEKKETVHDNPDGYEVMSTKADRDEEYYYAPTAKGKKGKSKKSGGEAGAKKPIKHNAETFRLFDQLKLDAPITTEDIPPLLEKLEEQLKSYHEKVKAWEVNREELKRKILAGEELPEDKPPAAPADDAKAEEKAEEKKDDEA